MKKSAGKNWPFKGEVDLSICAEKTSWKGLKRDVNQYLAEGSLA